MQLLSVSSNCLLSQLCFKLLLKVTYLLLFLSQKGVEMMVRGLAYLLKLTLGFLLDSLELGQVLKVLLDQLNCLFKQEVHVSHWHL